MEHYLSADEIVESIKDMSSWQGFYSRLYADIRENLAYEKKYPDWVYDLESKKLKDRIDMILELES